MRSARWPLPPDDESFGLVPKGHPRLWLAAGQADEMREWGTREGAAAVAVWVRRCEGQLGLKLPLEEQKQRQTGRDREGAVVQRVASKYAANKTGGWVQHLATMYLITGERWARKVPRAR